MNDCLHKRKNGTCEILSEKDGVQEFCVEGTCPDDTTLKGDFVRRTDALAVLEKANDAFIRNEIVSEFITMTRLIKNVKQIPAADVVEVVWCRDCKYWNANLKQCFHKTAPGMWREGNFFCANGERRADK